MASFLSRLNTREDGYGGSPEGRIRLPLDVFHRVRTAVGSNFPVGCRYLVDDVIEGGNRVQDAQFFGIEFARAGMDFLSLSKGGKSSRTQSSPRLGRPSTPIQDRAVTSACRRSTAMHTVRSIGILRPCLKCEALFDRLVLGYRSS